MQVSEKKQKPKTGFLFIANRSFKTLGKGSKSGAYPERIARETAMISGELSEALEIVTSGDVYGTEDLRKALACFTLRRVDCILVIFHSWAEDNIWVRFLRESDPSIPLIYFCPAKYSIPFENCEDENDLIEFTSSCGLTGSLAGAGSIPRMGRTAKVFAGAMRQKKNEIIEYARLCKIRNLLHQSRFGILPAYNEKIWNTYIDPYRMFAYGPEVTFVCYDEYVAISEKQVTAKEVAAWKDELKGRYPMNYVIDEEKFEASVRYSIGMHKVMEQFDIDAMTMNDRDTRLLERIGLRPGFYPNGINDSLSILCPDSDLGIAMAMYSLKLFTGRQINTLEPFYIDDSKNLFCGGHAGPNDYNYNESLEYVRISFDARFAKTGYHYAGAPFAWLRIPPGRMTMVHVSQINNEIKMVAALVDSLEGPHRINGCAHSEFRPVDTDISAFFEKILAIGTTQHFAAVPGEHIAPMRDFATLCGFTFYAV
jgi:L-arabinose isomerase